MQVLSSLEYLDLSRNRIGEVNPGTFLGMASLKGMDLSINNIRKVKTFAALFPTYKKAFCGQLQFFSMNTLIVPFKLRRN